MLLQIPKKELEKNLLIKDTKWYMMQLEDVKQEQTAGEITIYFSFFIPELDRSIERSFQFKWIGFIQPLLDAWKVEKVYQNGNLVFDPEKYKGLPIWGKIEHQAGTKNPGQLYNNLADF